MMKESLSGMIRLLHEKQVPFVCYRLPGHAHFTTRIQFSGRIRFVESYKHVCGEQGFVYAPFHRKTNFPVVFFGNETVVEGDRIDDSIPTRLERMEPLYSPMESLLPDATSKEAYLGQAKHLIQSLDKGLKKVVLSRVIRKRRPSDFDPGKMLRTLAEKNANAFVHLISIPGAGLWMGATPELLFRRQGQNCQTEALAGTRPFREGMKMVWEEKESEEQELVTAYIRQQLQGKGVVSFAEDRPTSVRAASMVHRKTAFRFQVDGLFDEGAFVDALHPTPAVCGLPKELALEQILGTEKHNREYYAGFCGPVQEEGKTQLFVNLRCLKLSRDAMALYVGSGLTGKSDPQKEWEETELKAGTLLSVM